MFFEHTEAPKQCFFTSLVKMKLLIFPCMKRAKKVFFLKLFPGFCFLQNFPSNQHGQILLN